MYILIILIPQTDLILVLVLLIVINTCLASDHRALCLQLSTKCLETIENCIGVVGFYCKWLNVEETELLFAYRSIANRMNKSGMQSLKAKISILKMNKIKYVHFSNPCEEKCARFSFVYLN